MKEKTLTGGEAIKALLKNIDVDKELKKAQEDIKKAKSSTEIDKLNNKIRYLRNLKELNIKPEEAYIVHNVPILPPKYRPIYPLPSGDLFFSDVNKLYQQLISANNLMAELKDLPDEQKKQQRAALYDAYRDIVGLGVPVVQKTQRKGIVEQIVGDRPKEGFFQSKLFTKRQELTGRAVIGSNPDLHIDEAEIPEDMLWTLYKPFIIQRLVAMGLTQYQAEQEYKNKTEQASNALELEIQNRPVMLNRAPSLHKHSIMAFIPKRTPDKQIKINPLVTKSFNADFNGDSISEDSLVVVKFNKEIIIDTVKNIAEKITGKTLSEMISEANGVTRIYDLSAGIKTIGLINQSPAWVPVKQLTVHTSHKECYKITTHTGKKVIVSEHHNFSYLDENLNLSLVKTDKLRVGRFIPASAQFEENVNLFDVWNKELIDGKTYNIDNDFAWLLGFYAGVGSISQNKNGKWISFCSCDNLILNEVERILFDKFSLHTKWQNTNQHKKYIVRLYNTCISNWFECNVGRSSSNKIIPACILNGSRSVKINFLAGLIDAEGSLYKTKKGNYFIKIGMRNKKIIEQLNTMLNFIGINSYLCIEDHNFHILRIASDTFISDLFLRGYKQNKLRECINYYQEKKNGIYTNFDIIPITQELKNRFHKIEFKTKKLNYINNSHSFYVNRHSAEEIALFYGNYEDDYIDKWKKIVANKKLRWERIEKIEKVKRVPVMFDFSVPVSETFCLVGGLITHNTMAVHVPISYKARDEAYEMMPSKNLFSVNNRLIMYPMREAILGLNYITDGVAKIDKKYRTEKEALDALKKGEIKVNNIIKVGNVETTPGRILVNQLFPPNLRDNNFVVTEKELNKKLSELARNNPNAAGPVIDKLKDLGFEWAEKSGLSIGIEDLEPAHGRKKFFIKTDKKVKEILDSNMPEKKKQEQINQVLDDYDKKMTEMANSIPKWNIFARMSRAGARGKTQNVKNFLTSPGYAQDIKDKVIPVPITHSFTEGMTSAEYAASLFDTRRGLIETNVQTSMPGYVTKELLPNTIKTQIVETDCGTTDGIMMDITDPEIMDRYVAKEVKGVVKRNQVVDQQVISRLEKQKVRKLLVRSPLTCKSLRGICSLCAGLKQGGQTYNIGENVGAIAGTALTEPLTQTMLGSKHGRLKGENKEKSFDIISRLLRMPKKFKNAAVVSTIAGKITKIEKNPAGGSVVYVENVPHATPPNQDVIVSVGKKVEEGDALTSGIINPQEMVVYKGIKPTQEYIANTLFNTYQNAGADVRKINIETVVRSLTDTVQITDPGESDFIRGDYAPAALVEEMNKNYKRKIKYQPALKGIRSKPLLEKDWMAQLAFERLPQVFAEGVAQGWKSDVAGINPVPAYIYGVEYDKRKLTPKKK